MDFFDNIPNRLTIFRIVLVPFVVLSLALSSMPLFNFLAVFIFIVASLTDFLDGHIARKMKLVTTFGSFLDPVADKLLVMASLIMLYSLDRINVFILILLISREFIITSLRLLATEQALSVKVSIFGKIKTALQMAAIPCLMIYKTFLGIPFDILGTILIYITVFFSIYSAMRYCQRLFLQLRKKQ